MRYYVCVVEICVPENDWELSEVSLGVNGAVHTHPMGHNDEFGNWVDGQARLVLQED